MTLKTFGGGGVQRNHGIAGLTESRVECQVGNRAMSALDVRVHSTHFLGCRGDPLHLPDRRTQRFPGPRRKTVDQQNEIPDVRVVDVLRAAPALPGTSTTAAGKATDSRATIPS